MKNSEPDPGLVIVGAAVTVYSVILVEIVMYLVATPLFMVGTLLLGIVVAGFVGRFVMGVLGDAAGAYPAPPRPVEVVDHVELAQTTAPVPAKRRRRHMPRTLHHA